MRPTFRTLAASVLLVGASSITAVVMIRCRSGQRPSGELSTIAGSPRQADGLLAWKPGVDELASLGCELFLEPHSVRLVHSTRSLPLIIRFPAIRAVSAFGEPLGSELTNLVQLPELEELHIRRCDLPDSLTFLEQLSGLRVLRIASSNLRDEHLQNVRLTMPLRTFDLSYNAEISERAMTCLLNVRSLRMLDLTSTAVTTLDFLDGMSELEELSLGQTRISDADLGFLVGLANLHVLDLSGTRITDSAMNAIAGIKSLHRLDVRYTQVSTDGVHRLKPSVGVSYHDERGNPSIREGCDCD